MVLLAHKQERINEQEEGLFRELDKGIADMEQGRTIPHKEAMQLIKERIKSYEL